MNPYSASQACKNGASKKTSSTDAKFQSPYHTTRKEQVAYGPQASTQIRFKTKAEKKKKLLTDERVVQLLKQQRHFLAPDQIKKDRSH